MAGPICRRVLVSGRVQGVFYRGWTCREAEKLGVSGWVRNLRDGRVEALLCGREEAVAALLARMNDGPPAARVDSVSVEEEPLPDRTDGPLQGFTQKPTL